MKVARESAETLVLLIREELFTALEQATNKDEREQLLDELHQLEINF